MSNGDLVGPPAAEKQLLLIRWWLPTPEDLFPTTPLETAGELSLPSGLQLPRLLSWVVLSHTAFASWKSWGISNASLKSQVRTANKQEETGTWRGDKFSEHMYVWYLNKSSHIISIQEWFRRHSNNPRWHHIHQEMNRICSVLYSSKQGRGDVMLWSTDASKWVPCPYRTRVGHRHLLDTYSTRIGHSHAVSDFEQL